MPVMEVVEEIAILEAEPDQKEHQQQVHPQKKAMAEAEVELSNKTMTQDNQGAQELKAWSSSLNILLSDFAILVYQVYELLSAMTSEMNYKIALVPIFMFSMDIFRRIAIHITLTSDFDVLSI